MMKLVIVVMTCVFCLAVVVVIWLYLFVENESF